MARRAFPVAVCASMPVFQLGQRVRVLERYPIGHYRVPLYLRGRSGIVERLVQPAIDNEEEGFGRNAGVKRHYYRIAVLMLDIWTAYAGCPQDRLYIEVFESWLEAAHNA